MDPSAEITDFKRKQEFIDHLYNVADSSYGMPTSCPCGGRIIDEVRVKEEYDTRPGKRFFSCINYEADGLHYRQPWVIGVQEEMVRMRERVDEAVEIIKCVPILTKQIDSLEITLFSIAKQRRQKVKKISSPYWSNMREKASG